MALLRLRLTASGDTVERLVNLLESIEGVERVERIADQMPHMDDEDSSSAGLHDVRGFNVFMIEVGADEDEALTRARAGAEALVATSDGVLEIVDRF